MSDALKGALIGHDVGRGMTRLLNAAMDFSSPRERAEGLPHATDGQYRQLFERYLKELNWAVALAIPWWNAIVHRRMASGEGEREALRASYFLRPAGPASRPEVVWVVRTFWLECERLNRASLPASRIPPQTFLLQSLQRPEHAVLLAVLSGMPYWPIGIDEDGSYC